MRPYGSIKCKKEVFNKTNLIALITHLVASSFTNHEISQAIQETLIYINSNTIPLTELKQVIKSAA